MNKEKKAEVCKLVDNSFVILEALSKEQNGISRCQYVLDLVRNLFAIKSEVENADSENPTQTPDPEPKKGMDQP